MYKLTIILLFTCFSYVNAQTEQIINQNWQFHQIGKPNWFAAKVPGCVHTDLMDNKLIPDPYYRDNEKLVQWIENEDWEYSASFEVEQGLYSKQNLTLCFKGLDTYADVYLNDSLILKTDNMYRSWTVPCKKLIKSGKNSLRILFHSAVNEGLRKAALYSYRLPNHNEKTDDARKSGSQTRKSPHQFGWDTHPRLVTCGIWRPVIIEGWDNAQIENNYFEPIKIDAKLGQYNVNTSITATADMKCKLAVYVNNSKTPASIQDIALKKGSNLATLKLNIENPALWWPNGMGKPNLYTVKVVLSNVKGVIDEYSERIGVRSIEVVRDNDSIGRSFYFRVNGLPLFIKGSNYVPAEALPTMVTSNQYTDLVKNAVASNINLLRVWGGAIYENDIFYNLCAENGILVWQDFMYACSMYPSDSAFLENIKLETIENVKRLRNNPALALWCGNNELISGWHEWGWPRDPKLNISKTDSVYIFQGYLKIFNDIIPNVIKQLNPQTFYWPSSPGADLGKSSSLSSGDLHYYFVWYGSSSIQTYKTTIPRFMSEYGVQSLPTYYTFKKYFSKDDENLFSPVMMHRQKSVMPWIKPDMEGNKMLMRYLNEDYKNAKDFENLIYLSQLFQADAIKIATEAHRINKPRCMGSMYWQFGDSWPNIGWSVIDYLGKKKAAYYIAKKAFSNIMVIPALSDTTIGASTMLNVFVNSDSIKPIKAKLAIKLLDFNGTVHFSKELEVKVDSLSNKIFFAMPTTDLLKGYNPTEVVLSTVLQINKQIISNNLLYFGKPKSLLLQKPEIKTSITQTTDGFNFELVSNTLAKSVCLSLPNGDDNFSANFFDILPGEKVKVTLKSSLSLDKLKDELVIRSLIDSY